MMVMLTTGEKKENSNKFRNPGPEKRSFIHWKSIKRDAIPRKEPKTPCSKPSSKNGVLM
jgi:hypothetical protein